LNRKIPLRPSFQKEFLIKRDIKKRLDNREQHTNISTYVDIADQQSIENAATISCKPANELVIVAARYKLSET
jgi:hypothetical protein